MTTSEPQYLAAATAAALSGRLIDADEERSDGVPIGSGDVEADRLRSGGAEAQLDNVPRDSDGVPVGREDAREDARRSGADPDVV